MIITWRTCRTNSTYTETSVKAVYVAEPYHALDAFKDVMCAAAGSVWQMRWGRFASVVDSSGNRSVIVPLHSLQKRQHCKWCLMHAMAVNNQTMLLTVCQMYMHSNDDTHQIVHTCDMTGSLRNPCSVTSSSTGSCPVAMLSIEFICWLLCKTWILVGCHAFVRCHLQLLPRAGCAHACGITFSIAQQPMKHIRYGIVSSVHKRQGTPAAP